MTEEMEMGHVIVIQDIAEQLVINVQLIIGDQVVYHVLAIQLDRVLAQTE